MQSSAFVLRNASRRTGENAGFFFQIMKSSSTKVVVFHKGFRRINDGGILRFLYGQTLGGEFPTGPSLISDQSKIDLGLSKPVSSGEEEGFCSSYISSGRPISCL